MLYFQALWPLKLAKNKKHKKPSKVKTERFPALTATNDAPHSTATNPATSNCGWTCHGAERPYITQPAASHVELGQKNGWSKRQISGLVISVHQRCQDHSRHDCSRQDHSRQDHSCQDHRHTAADGGGASHWTRPAATTLSLF